MKGGAYYSHLLTLDKKQLIKLLYETKKTSKPFPHKSYRTVALRLAYDGTHYSGVQHHAFIRSIEEELQTSVDILGIGEELVFCGRTDAGVSAISMVVSLRVKSRHAEPNRSYNLREDDADEYPYDKIINERLPGDIRVTGWAPVPDDFNARHSCTERTYKYYFILGNMQLNRMLDAAQRICEMTNFYKLSTHSNPRAIYDRRISSLEIKKVEERPRLDGDTGSNTLYCMTIRARSFLHNMVRKIMWVIKNCGEGNEFTLENVRIAEPYPLVFVGARFPQKLNFIGNRFTGPHFEEEEARARILHKIAELKLATFDKND